MKNFTDELRAQREASREAIDVERITSIDERLLVDELGLATRTTESRAKWLREHTRRLTEDAEYAAAVERLRAAHPQDLHVAGIRLDYRDSWIIHELRMEFDAAYAAEFPRWCAAVDELLAARAARRAHESLRRRGIPEKDIELVLDVERLQETPALRHVLAFAGTGKTILVLSGPPGVGKTLAMSWALSTDLPRSQRLVTAAQLSRCDRYDQGVMGGILHCDALGIDDLGSEFVDKGGFFMALLDEVINERYAARRRMVITTNLNLSSFTKRYGLRILDRIREVGAFAELDGASLRGKKS